MTRGFHLFKISGIQISVDYTWFIVFMLFSWSLGFGYFPLHYPGLGRASYLVMGVVSSLLLFVCVLIHELSHSVASNRLGLRIHGITLFIFGGVAELTKEPETPSVELKIAVAGPIASAVLALFFRGAAYASGTQGSPVVTAVLNYLAMINTALLVFNMIPGFPLDGGRVLRALWWMKTNDLTASTRLAAGVGKGFAALLIIAGFLQAAAGNFIGGLWSIFIGVFLQQSAEGGYRRLVIKNALEGVLVKDVMSRGVVSIDSETIISEAIERYFLSLHYACFPVTSGNALVGMLTLKDVKGLNKDEWGRTPVKAVMRAIGPDDVLGPEESALTALRKLTESSIGRCPVIGAGGEITGLLSRSDIMRMMEFKDALKH